MKRYFKRRAESDLGEGIAYIEITDDWPSRQVEIYGETWRWGDVAHKRWLADQPFALLDLREEHAVAAGEFEHEWSEAQRRCPPSS